MRGLGGLGDKGERWRRMEGSGECWGKLVVTTRFLGQMHKLYKVKRAKSADTIT